MKEHPILFSGEMVRAILDGRKTTTRRVVKGMALTWLGDSINFSPEYVTHPENGMCPYGVPGDFLYVREAWAVHECYDRLPPREIKLGSNDHIFYSVASLGGMAGFEGRSRRSIHMPRWASRINLEVVSVRVERLQEIKPEDAIREGYPFGAPEATGPETYLDWFSETWNTINAKRGHPWEANDWVWVIGFNKLEAE